MKVINLELPRLFDYCVSNEISKRVKDVILSGDAWMDKDYIMIYSRDGYGISAGLHEFAEKASITTAGNKTTYEYEEGIEDPKIAVFTITTEDNLTRECCYNFLNTYKDNSVQFCFTILKS